MRITKNKCPDIFLCYLKSNENNNRDYIKAQFVKHHIPLLVRRKGDRYHAETDRIFRYYCSQDTDYHDSRKNNDSNNLHSLVSRLVHEPMRLNEYTCSNLHILMSDIDELIPLSEADKHL